MLVDPATGEPISDGSGPSFGKAVVQDALENADMKESRLMEASNYIPASRTTAGWNAYRGERTILKGLNKRGHVGKPNFLGMSGKGTFHPSNWGRMPSYEAMHPYDKAAREGKYTPFNFLGGDMGEKVMGRLVKGGDTRLAKHVLNGTERAALRRGEAGPQMVSGGVYSRMSASARAAGWGNPARAAKPRQAYHTAKFIKATDPALSSIGESMYGAGFKSASRAELADMIGMSNGGRVGQYVSGYFRGSSGIGDHTGQLLLRANREGTARTGFSRGMASAARHLGNAGLERTGTGGLQFARAAGGGGRYTLEAARLEATFGEAVSKKAIGEGVEKLGIRSLGRVAESAGLEVAAKAGVSMGARAIGMAIPGVNVVMTAMLAYDLTKMGIAGLKGGMQTTKEGFQSFQGQLYKPTMGMGYKDTEVAATSRQRGVMAIQNSRLNARSALGNEAAPLAAHFG